MSGPLIIGPGGDFYGVTLLGGDNDRGTAFRMKPTGELTTLAHFDSSRGSHPNSLILASDGNFYGTTRFDGSGRHGTVFRCTPAGEVTVLVNFGGANGHSPNGSLIQGDDGHLYGATQFGGKTSSAGILFQITLNGAFSILADFSESPLNVGQSPVGPITRLPDGTIYGVTRAGRQGVGLGSIFKYTPGSGITALHSIQSGEGGNLTSLVRASDGNFYGTASSGGTNGFGTIFRVSADGDFSVLAQSELNGLGLEFSAALTEASDGNLYAVSARSGLDSLPTLYRVEKSGTVTAIAPLLDEAGRYPTAVIQGSDGALYGGTAENDSLGIPGGIFRITLQGQCSILNPLVHRGSMAPVRSLVEGPDRNVYGTTAAGGSHATGTFFRVGAASPLVTLGSFPRDNPAERINPEGPLHRSSDGYYYGTARGNGTSYVYRASTAGDIHVLYQWQGPRDGSHAFGPVVEASDGNLYGVTTDGLLYCLTKAGAFSVLKSFPTSTSAAETTGTSPGPGLTLGPDGHLYGITRRGGAHGYGTAFRVTIRGTLTTLAHFSPGGEPRAPLLLASDGNFYGLAHSYFRYGNLFRLTPDGTLSTVTGFTSTLHPRVPDLSGPACLVEDSNGNFLTPSNDPTGTVKDSIIRISKAGAVNRAYIFNPQTHRDVSTSLIAASDGSLYGSTTAGGVAGGGTVYRLFVSPAITGLNANEITPSSASLRANVNPCGFSTNVHFEFGETRDLGETTEPVPLEEGSMEIETSTSLSELIPGTSYHYRVVAVSAEGISRSPIKSFTTAPGTPLAITGESERLTTTSLRITGIVHSGGYATTARFEFGPDENFGQLTSEIAVPGTSDSGVFASAVVTRPKAGESLYYRMIAASEQGQSVGASVAVQGPSIPIVTAPFAKGMQVTGAGAPGTGIPTGSTWRSFGIPCTNNAGNVAFVANTRAEGRTRSAIYRFPSLAEVPAIVAQRGEPTHSGNGRILFGRLHDPVMNENGDVAFIANLTGPGIKPSNNQGIFVQSTSLSSERLLALKGSQVPGFESGVYWKAFTNIVLTDVPTTPGRWKVAFTAVLAGRVNRANDTGLWITESSTPMLALREGQRLSINGITKSVQQFFALAALEGSLLHGHGGTPLGVPVKVVFSDRSEALLHVTATESGPLVRPLAVRGDFVPKSGHTQLENFRLPTQDSSGNFAAWIGSIFTGVFSDAVMRKDQQGVVKVVARVNEVASTSSGDLSSKFAAFQTVAINSASDSALRATIHGPTISALNDSILARQLTGQPWEIIAQEGTHPPGTPSGTNWAEFPGFTLGDLDSALWFFGKLRIPPRTEANPAGIKKSNDTGIWIAPPNELPQLIVREGDTLNGGTILQFSPLVPVSRSQLQRRSISSDGRSLLMRVVMSDGSQQLLHARYPSLN